MLTPSNLNEPRTRLSNVLGVVALLAAATFGLLVVSFYFSYHRQAEQRRANAALSINQRIIFQEIQRLKQGLNIEALETPTPIIPPKKVEKASPDHAAD